ncbi:YopX family protein [Campylobacter upsaliensis]|uniref:YopX family protein n=1 Tax=Campylobacter upsaliensis TaxID=28080 RepID=UPI0022EAE6B7|nr:YopX family protein [Campylobacter upsaliensis]
MKLKDFDFRIWNNSTDKFIELNISYNIRAIPRKHDDLVLELWSGFYDSKGTKIYEGDIVKYRSNTTPLVAVFERSTFYIVDTSIVKHLQVDCAMHLQSLYENRDKGYTNNKLECLQVLGNIHKNADLLKEQNETKKFHNQRLCRSIR